jgi:hypothetical protein
MRVGASELADPPRHSHGFADASNIQLRFTLSYVLWFVCGFAAVRSDPPLRRWFWQAAAADTRGAGSPDAVAPHEWKGQGMNRKKLTIVSFVAIPLIAGGGVVVAESAFAGTNGQRIQLCQPKSDYQSAWMRGLDQNGAIQERTVDNLKEECTTVDGSYWKGKVHINWTDAGPAGKARGVPQTYGTDCDVPVNGQDPFACYSADVLPDQHR